MVINILEILIQYGTLDCKIFDGYDGIDGSKNI